MKKASEVILADGTNVPFENIFDVAATAMNSQPEEA